MNPTPTPSDIEALEGKLASSQAAYSALFDQFTQSKEEIARLENIIKIQEKQIERLMTARDIEKAKREELEARIANALT